MYLDEIETRESFIEIKKKECNECGERVELYRIMNGRGRRETRRKQPATSPEARASDAYH